MLAPLFSTDPLTCRETSGLARNGLPQTAAAWSLSYLAFGKQSDRRRSHIGHSIKVKQKYAIEK